ncbi:MAG: glucokinase [Halioglobus sp.]|jgi:glucokinase
MEGKPWYLVADIGGTNARFGLEDYASTELGQIERLSVADHSQFADALRHYLEIVADSGGWQRLPRAACLALACPVNGDRIQFTNSPWTVDRVELSGLLNQARVELINDFAAVGHAVTELRPRDWCQIGGGASDPDRPVAILGPGTGLGVCSLVPIGAGYKVIEGEGGHVDFAPVDPQEIAVLELLTRRFGRVSVERMLSGAGLLNIYGALAELLGQPVHWETPAQITDSALSGVDSLAVRTLEMFCRVLGSVAGNLALTLGARGGVYIAGGIVPRFIDFIEASEFRQRFDSKGRFSNYLRDIPVRVITKEDLGLSGAVKRLKMLDL